MKILYIAPQLPYPPDSGGKIKTLSTLKSIINLGWEIYLFSFINTRNQKIRNQLYTGLRKIGIKHINTVYNPYINESNKLRLIKKLISSFISLKPYWVLRYYNKKFADKINLFLKHEKIDIFWINSILMTQYLPKSIFSLKVFESYDIEGHLLKYIFKKSHFWHLRLLGLFEWIKFSFYEKKVYKNYDFLFSISKRDRDNLIKITGNKNVIVLPPRYRIIRSSFYSYQ